MTISTLERFYDGPTEISFRSADVQDALLIYSNASRLSKGDLLSLSLPVSPASTRNYL